MSDQQQPVEVPGTLNSFLAGLAKQVDERLDRRDAIKGTSLHNNRSRSFQDGYAQGLQGAARSLRAAASHLSSSKDKLIEEARADLKLSEEARSAERAGRKEERSRADGAEGRVEQLRELVASYVKSDEASLVKARTSQQSPRRIGHVEGHLAATVAILGDLDETHPESPSPVTSPTDVPEQVKSRSTAAILQYGPEMGLSEEQAQRLAGAAVGAIYDEILAASRDKLIEELEGELEEAQQHRDHWKEEAGRFYDFTQKNRERAEAVEQTAERVRTELRARADHHAATIGMASPESELRARHEEQALRAALSFFDREFATLDSSQENAEQGDGG